MVWGQLILHPKSESLHPPRFICLYYLWSPFLMDGQATWNHSLSRQGKHPAKWAIGDILYLVVKLWCTPSTYLPWVTRLYNLCPVQWLLLQSDIGLVFLKYLLCLKCTWPSPPPAGANLLNNGSSSTCLPSLYQAGQGAVTAHMYLLFIAGDLVSRSMALRMSCSLSCLPFFGPKSQTHIHVPWLVSSPAEDWTFII